MAAVVEDEKVGGTEVEAPVEDVVKSEQPLSEECE